MKKFFIRNRRIIIITFLTILLHAILLVSISWYAGGKQERADNTVFKMVDVKEYIPPKEEDKIEIAKQESIAEDVIETDKNIKELDIDYLPQHKISEMPVIPMKEFNSRKVYPPLANKQGIEGTVFLELYIDQNGNIRDIKILRDPGYGFGEAAVKALTGLKCIPAKANGLPVAAKIRYPVRFALK